MFLLQSPLPFPASAFSSPASLIAQLSPTFLSPSHAPNLNPFFPYLPLRCCVDFPYFWATWVYVDPRLFSFHGLLFFYLARSQPHSLSIGSSFACLHIWCFSLLAMGSWGGFSRGTWASSSPCFADDQQTPFSGFPFVYGLRASEVHWRVSLCFRFPCLPSRCLAFLPPSAITSWFSRMDDPIPTGSPRSFPLWFSLCQQFLWLPQTIPHPYNNTHRMPSFPLEDFLLNCH